MAKIQRLVTIDSELNEKLKQQENASGLINSLLLSHFDYIETDNLDLLESKKLEKSNKREILDKELEHITDKIILLKQREKQIKISEDKRKRLEELKDLSTDLLQKWQREEIKEEEYWAQIVVVQKEKNSILSNIRGVNDE